MSIDTDHTLTGVSLHPGEGIGELLVLGEALSFYGGVDHNGTITAVRHPQDGIRLGLDHLQCKLTKRIFHLDSYRTPEETKWRVNNASSG